MLSSQGRIQSLLLDDTAFTLSFTEKTLKKLRKYENIFKKFSLHEVLQEDQKNENLNFSLEDLANQFSMIEEILETEYNKKKTHEKWDQLKVALEYYKLAIMQILLYSLSENEEKDSAKKPSLLMHGIYGFLFLGGTWNAYLHGYDAVSAISGLLPCHVPNSIVWGAGSFLFLIALGLFSAFEADALSKHMGFQSIKNLKNDIRSSSTSNRGDL